MMSLLYHSGGLLALVVFFMVCLIHEFGGYKTASAADQSLTPWVGPGGMLEFFGIDAMRSAAGTQRCTSRPA
jgi:hypothetical protein